MVNLVSSSGKLFLLCVCWKHRCGIGFSCCHLHADENYCAWRIFCAMGEVITSYICIVVSWWLSFASPSVLSICLYHWICVRGFYLCNDSLKRSSGTPPTRSVTWFFGDAQCDICVPASIALGAVVRHECCRPFKRARLHFGCPRWHRTSGIFFIYLSLSCDRNDFRHIHVNIGSDMTCSHT